MKIFINCIIEFLFGLNKKRFERMVNAEPGTSIKNDVMVTLKYLYYSGQKKLLVIAFAEYQKHVARRVAWGKPEEILVYARQMLLHPDSYNHISYEMDGQIGVEMRDIVTDDFIYMLKERLCR